MAAHLASRKASTGGSGILRAVRDVAGGLGWPEGPSVLDDGRIVFVEKYSSGLSIWSPEERESRHFAFTGGGPGATALGSDGSLYVTQNGGVMGRFVAETQVPPSIQRVSPDGSSVEIVATEVAGRKLRSPNDLAFGADGRLYFTDPGRIDLSNPDQRGCVFALNPDGSGELIAEMPPTFPNGIAADHDGSIVWVETLTRAVTRYLGDGRTEHICTLPEGHRPDGLAIAADGCLYIAVTDAGGIDVVDREGAVIDFLAVGSVVTNCAFSGSTLYVTDGNQGPMLDPAFVGHLWAIELEAVAAVAPFRGTVERHA